MDELDLANSVQWCRELDVDFDWVEVDVDFTLEVVDGVVFDGAEEWAVDIGIFDNFKLLEGAGFGSTIAGALAFTVANFGSGRVSGFDPSDDFGLFDVDIILPLEASDDFGSTFAFAWDDVGSGVWGFNIFEDKRRCDFDDDCLFGVRLMPARFPVGFSDVRMTSW